MKAIAFLFRVVRVYRGHTFSQTRIEKNSSLPYSLADEDLLSCARRPLRFAALPRLPIKEENVFWGTIHRMILVELLKIFFMALVALTGIILLAGVISEAMKNGFGPAQILACIPLLLPSLLPYTVPTTTLFATCIVYGRLSADNEILALKAAGVHIIHVVWPALLIGLVTSAVTMFCYIDIIPYTGFLLRTQIIGDVEEMLYAMLRKDGCIKHQKINWEINVKSVNGRKLQEVIFQRKAPGVNKAAPFDTIAWAKEAELRVDMTHKQILVHMRQCHVYQPDGTVGYVEERVWPVEIVGEWGAASTKQRTMDMTWSELFEYERMAQQDKQELGEKLDLLQAANGLRVGDPTDKDAIDSLMKEWQYRDDLIRAIHAEWQMRPSLAL
jgi:lipopolysaccharide export LptBFGC system permease protein LptF